MSFPEKDKIINSKGRAQINLTIFHVQSLYTINTLRLHNNKYYLYEHNTGGPGNWDVITVYNYENNISQKTASPQR